MNALPGTNSDLLYEIKESVAVMASQIPRMQADIADIKKTLEAHYVTQNEFYPVKTIVYGLVTLILMGVVGALITLVIR